MTEEEAKTKWCPQTLGRTPPNPECCSAAACMAWRVDTENADLAPGFVRTLNRDGSTTIVRAATAKHYDWKTVQVDGFCGLAGRPA